MIAKTSPAVFPCAVIVKFNFLSFFDSNFASPVTNVLSGKTFAISSLKVVNSSAAVASNSVKRELGTKTHSCVKDVKFPCPPL